MTQPYIVLDLETRYSADDCKYCALPKTDWNSPPSGFGSCSNDDGHETIGWRNHPGLGLSIGCYWNSSDARVYWFDEHNLVGIMAHLVDGQPLMVSWNGLAFDFVLMRGILRRRAETLPPHEAIALTDLCDQFKELATVSYDMLDRLWLADPATKRVKGLNGLDSVSLANGLPGKTGDGAQAPRDWAAGKIAQTCNYCQNDVYLTKALFERVLLREPIRRVDGSTLYLPQPVWPGASYG